MKSLMGVNLLSGFPAGTTPAHDPGMAPMCKVGGGGDGFTPPDIANLGVWAEANMTGADLVLDAGKAEDWGKTEGGLTNLTQTTAGNRFTYVATAGDGLPELTMVSASSTHMLSASAMSIGVKTVFVVAKNNANDSRLFDGTSGAAIDYLGAETTAVPVAQHYRSGSQWSRKRWSGSAADGTYALWTLIQDGTHAGHDLRRDGVLLTASDVNTTDPGTGTGSVTLVVGGESASRFSNGAIRAFLWYNRALTAQEISDVEGYLNTAWSVF